MCAEKQQLENKLSLRRFRVTVVPTMSTFPGCMQEYTCISLDRFDGKNLKSTVYFLSHSHADHTVGLDSDNFIYRLRSNKHIKLYCSEITKNLLLMQEKYRLLAPSIEALKDDESRVIPLPDPVTAKVKQHVTVTGLHAAHCPGSMMFLFEGNEGTVLYTGDFRLDRHEVEQMQHLHSGTRAKELRSLYIDTTFLKPEALFIPSRQQSAEAILEIAREWISQGPQHMLVIAHMANLGYEYVYKRLCEEFNQKVHVNLKKYKEYEKVGDMAKYTTTDPTETQIHACRWTDRVGDSQLPCGYVPETYTDVKKRTVRLSTMTFVKDMSLENWARRKNERYFHVCYSFHCSYSEIRHMVLHLAPKQAFANVKPAHWGGNRIQQRLDQFVELAKVSQPPESQSPTKFRPLGQMKRKRKRQVSQSLPSSQSDNGGLFLEDSYSKKAKVEKSKVEQCSRPEKKFSLLFSSELAKEDDSQPPLSGGGDNQPDQDELQEAEKDYNTDDEEKSCGSAMDKDDELEEEEDEEDAEKDQDSQAVLLAEDAEDIKSFTPVKGGSFGDFVGYVSDEDCDEEELIQCSMMESSEKKRLCLKSEEEEDSLDKLLGSDTPSDEDTPSKTVAAAVGSGQKTEGRDESESKKEVSPPPDPSGATTLTLSPIQTAAHNPVLDSSLEVVDEIKAPTVKPTVSSDKGDSKSITQQKTSFTSDTDSKKQGEGPKDEEEDEDIVCLDDEGSRCSTTATSEMFNHRGYRGRGLGSRSVSSFSVQRNINWLRDQRQLAAHAPMMSGTFHPGNPHLCNGHLPSSPSTAPAVMNSSQGSNASTIDCDISNLRRAPGVIDLTNDSGEESGDEEDFHRQNLHHRSSVSQHRARFGTNRFDPDSSDEMFDDDETFSSEYQNSNDVVIIDDDDDDDSKSETGTLQEKSSDKKTSSETDKSFEEKLVTKSTDVELEMTEDSAKETGQTPCDKSLTKDVQSASQDGDQQHPDKPADESPASPETNKHEQTSEPAQGAATVSSKMKTDSNSVTESPEEPQATDSLSPELDIVPKTK